MVPGAGLSGRTWIFVLRLRWARNAGASQMDRAWYELHLFSFCCPFCEYYSGPATIPTRLIPTALRPCPSLSLSMRLLFFFSFPVSVLFSRLWSLADLSFMLLSRNTTESSMRQCQDATTAEGAAKVAQESAERPQRRSRRRREAQSPTAARVVKNF
ncbi:hypothetical protein C8R47DRAFT_1086952 [Mycena vitilis]|nr:hypothetical protein C8R47DRAFT_1086952 [Mycena vitilis]